MTTVGWPALRVSQLFFKHGLVFVYPCCNDELDLHLDDGGIGMVTMMNTEMGIEPHQAQIPLGLDLDLANKSNVLTLRWILARNGY
jgi:hypothetical protein